MTNQMPERIYVGVTDKGNLVAGCVPDGDTPYVRADLAQKTVTREEVMRIALESGIMLSTQYGQSDGKLMPVSDAETLVNFAKSLLKVSD